MLSVQSLVGSAAKPLTINLANASLRSLARTAYAHFNSVQAAKFDPHEFPDQYSDRRSSYSGVKIEEKVELDSGKLRLDSWISSRINGISRARVQSSIRSGLVSVNGRVISKVSHVLRDGDLVNCMIAELQPLKAEPENIPLDIVYEDEHVLVVNKPAFMVVHPAPGNATGTLVNGILHHCSLPDMCFNPETLPGMDGDSGDEGDAFSIDESRNEAIASIRPGIVHRLDKGTSGLLVVAKDEHSHSHLADQFKNHTIKRVYVSLTCGVPSPTSGYIDVSIGRDTNNRIRMVAIPGSSGHVKTRYAASRYKVIEILAGGSCALVEWRLETGRTHQIRAHAKYLGVPLLGDEVYSGTKSMALSLLQSRNPFISHNQLLEVVDRLERPCLHALSLGFKHPSTWEDMQFYQMPPADFAEILDLLRDIGIKKVK
ncbi:RNA pseudouridine synthase 2, chloroplastic isoform X2 [Andrographis paniculata]|uniref:RNA pseudouridine synthase 2, chloroplastic isoform X2 n=1 Tax=Andrographis paniculata TaxID=175694 RepID=UPI0021E71BFF|nr:RNA pseudouridine synthase 2, chloroplastic isoform X2 [Andrographis paniculata]